MAVNCASLGVVFVGEVEHAAEGFVAFQEDDGVHLVFRRVLGA